MCLQAREEFLMETNAEKKNNQVLLKVNHRYRFIYGDSKEIKSPNSAECERTQRLKSPPKNSQMQGKT